MWLDSGWGQSLLQGAALVVPGAFSSDEADVDLFESPEASVLCLLTWASQR